MKSNMLKFMVIVSAVLFIGTGVSWADGYRGKGHNYYGKGNHYKNLYKHKYHQRGYSPRMTGRLAQQELRLFPFTPGFSQVTGAGAF